MIGINTREYLLEVADMNRISHKADPHKETNNESNSVNQIIRWSVIDHSISDWRILSHVEGFVLRSVLGSVPKVLVLLLFSARSFRLLLLLLV